MLRGFTHCLRLELCTELIPIISCLLKYLQSSSAPLALPLVSLQNDLIGFACVFQLFQPLIGHARVGRVAVVEFLSDRELEFYSEREELHPYEVCV